MDRYSVISDEQWETVCSLLHDDIAQDRSRGIIAVAPSDPAAGNEMIIGFELDTPNMRWAPNAFERPLSRVILDNNSIADEVLRAAASLQNTAAILIAAAASMKD